MNVEYQKIRTTYNQKRSLLWEVLAKEYFQKLVSENDCVLDLGAGYGDFINNIKAGKKIAVDHWSGTKKYLNDDVEYINTSLSDLRKIKDNSIDLVLASNVFEHLTHVELKQCLDQLINKMRKNGLIVILQPNFKYAYKNYFDDYTHKSIFTEIGLVDFLKSFGFELVECKKKFLPLTIKSKFPVIPLLIKIYIRFPIKIFAKQMLIIMKKSDS